MFLSTSIFGSLFRTAKIFREHNMPRLCPWYSRVDRGSFPFILLLQPLYHGLEALLCTFEFGFMLYLRLHRTEPAVPGHALHCVSVGYFIGKVVLAPREVVAALEVIKLWYLKYFRNAHIISSFQKTPLPGRGCHILPTGEALSTELTDILR